MTDQQPGDLDALFAQIEAERSTRAPACDQHRARQCQHPGCQRYTLRDFCDQHRASPDLGDDDQ